MSLLESIRKEARSILHFDSGELFLQPGHSLDPNEIKRNALLIVRAYQAMEVDAINVGDTDLFIGLDFLNKEAQKGLPLISANIMSRNDRKPIFTPYIIRETSGVRFGIFGLAQDKARMLPQDMLDKVFIEDPIVAAKAIMAELKGKVDVILSLSDLEERMDKILAKKVQGIDFILSGHNKQLPIDLTQVGTTWIFHPYHYKGMYMGRIDLTIKEEDLGMLKGLNKDLQSLERKLFLMESRLNSPSLEAEIRALRDKKKDIEGKLKKAKAIFLEGSHFSIQSVEIDQGILEHREWRQIFQSVVREMNLEK